MENAIKYPYLPHGRTIKYVEALNPYMVEARRIAKEYSLDKNMPNASIIVDPENGKVVGVGANGSNYHEIHGCERIRLHIPTGQGYELCEGCSPQNHGEPKAILDAEKNGYNVSGMDLYLWGHWWCCEPCWRKMIEVGIRDVYLLEKSEILFNKENPDNIIGYQFDY